MSVASLARGKQVQFAPGCQDDLPPKRMRRPHHPISFVLAAVLAAGFVVPVAADFNRGFDAWDRGQYKQAIREFRACLLYTSDAADE